MNNKKNSEKTAKAARVCLIQDKVIFEDDTRKSLLKIKKAQLLTSTDEVEIYKFIVRSVSKYGIYRFVFHINSTLLSKLVKYMEDKQQCSKKTRNWMEKCIFFATLSTGETVRKNLKVMDLNVYFTSSTISTVLNNVPNGKIISSPPASEEIKLDVALEKSILSSASVANSALKAVLSVSKTIDEKLGLSNISNEERVLLQELKTNMVSLKANVSNTYLQTSNTMSQILSTSYNNSIASKQLALERMLNNAKLALAACAEIFELPPSYLDEWWRRRLGINGSLSFDLDFSVDLEEYLKNLNHTRSSFACAKLSATANFDADLFNQKKSYLAQINNKMNAISATQGEYDLIPILEVQALLSAKEVVEPLRFKSSNISRAAIFVNQTVLNALNSNVERLLTTLDEAQDEAKVLSFISKATQIYNIIDNMPQAGDVQASDELDRVEYVTRILKVLQQLPSDGLILEVAPESLEALTAAVRTMSPRSVYDEGDSAFEVETADDIITLVNASSSVAASGDFTETTYRQMAVIANKLINSYQKSEYLDKMRNLLNGATSTLFTSSQKTTQLMQKVSQVEKNTLLVKSNSNTNPEFEYEVARAFPIQELSTLEIATPDSFEDALANNDDIGTIVVAVSDDLEMLKVANVIEAKKYIRHVVIIEANIEGEMGIDALNKLRLMASDVSVISAGVSMQVSSSELNNSNRYESCAVAVTRTPENWESYVKNDLVIDPKKD